MTGFDNHKVVTSKNLQDWLYNVASDHGESIWVGGTANYVTLTKADIVNEVWATYSTDENTTGIYITGYSVGDGKSGYANNQNVIAADIAYREAATPSDRVFKVFLEGDPDETNKGYFASNTVGETVTFVIRTNISIEEQPITINSRSATHTTPTSAVYDSTSDYYYYTFDVELTTVNSGNNVIGEVFSVTQGTASSDVVVYIPGTVENTGGLLYTGMPYTYTFNNATYDSTNGYNATNSYSYSFVANLGGGSGTKTVTFPALTQVVGSRISTGSEILGVHDIQTIRSDFKINQPAMFRMNVGKRTFTSKRDSEQTVEVKPDSTVLFSMNMDVSGTTSYSTPYPQYFALSGTDIILDSSFGQGGDNAGTKFENSSILAKLADSGDAGTITIKGKDVTGSASGNDWWSYNGYYQDYDVYNIDNLDGNITLNNAGNFRIIAYRQNGTTLRLVIAGNGSGNTYPSGYSNFVASFGDTIAATIDGTNTTLNIIRPKSGAYQLNCIYVDISNYNSSSSYVIDIPSEKATFLEDETFCRLAYSFGSGVKCLDPDAVTTRLWKPSSDQIQVYENLSEIKLCDVYMRDGLVPRCEKSYVKFRMVDNSKELIQYEAYVDNISSILQELNNSITLQIRITSTYDSHAKQHDDFEPEATIVNGFYSVSNKSNILASVTMDGNTACIQFCTTNGYYSTGSTVTQSAVAVESYNVANQYFDGADRIMFNIGSLSGLADTWVFNGFVELAAGSNINIIGSMRAFGWGD